MEAAKQKNNGIFGKIGAFFDKHYALFFAPIIVAVIYAFALWQYGVYPFGDKYTAASYDLSAQICPFIEHLFDVFDGKSTLTFSYAIVGGADVTGTFLYFFISPFSFLFLIFGDGKVAHASSIVMLFKLMAIAVSGTWFAKKLFKDIPDYICLAIGVAYTYCGYTFVSNTYINWMDFLIYLPFATAAFKHFVKTGKFLPFSILVACCIYTCFSIACFSLFTVFPALVVYGLVCIEKERRYKFIAYLCLSFGVAILIALPVLFPALGAYSVSGRGGGLFENLWKGYAQTSSGELSSFNSSTFLNSYSESLYRKWSYILSDAAFVVLTIVWFFRKGLRDGFSKFMFVAGALTLLPTVVDESMNLLNMGSYMSYALRFGFLNSLYFLGGACLCIESFCYKPFTAYDGTSLLDADFTVVEKVVEDEEGEEREGEELSEEESAPVWRELAGMSALNAKNDKKTRTAYTWAGVLIALGAIVAITLLWYCNGDNYKRVMKWFGSDADGFAGAFAHSLGGLDVIMVIFIGVALVTVVGCFLVGGKKVSPRLLSFVLIAVCSVQILFYNDALVVGNRSTQHVRLGNYELLTEELQARDDEYFRIKDYNDKMTACAPFTGGGNSFSIFSSVIDKDNFTAMELFGYLGNGKNSFKSSHNQGKGNRSDEFGDAFLGYKYFVTDNTNKIGDKTTTKAGNLSYAEPVYELDENGQILLDKDGNKVQLKRGDLYVYENKIVFPLGYKVQSGGFEFAVKNTNNRSNRKTNQQALYKYLRGEDLQTKWNNQFVTPESATELSEYLHTKAADVEVSAGKIVAKVTGKKGEDLLLNFVAVNGYEVTVNGKKAELVENDLNFLLVSLEEGENEVVFTYKSPYPKYMAVGLVAAVLGLLLVALLLKKTKVVEKLAPVIAWAGILIAVGVVAFFMLYPSGVFLSKGIALLKSWLF